MTTRSRRARAFLAIVAIAVAALAAPRASAQEAPSKIVPPLTLAQLRERGELRWGCDSQGGAPYVFQDPMDPNHLVGFEVDLAGALAAKLGVKARPIQGQWENLLELLKRGDFDVALNGIEIAEEKKRVCDLSRCYYVANEKLCVRKGDATAPRSATALKGRKVGTLPGTLAERILEREGAEVKAYEGGQGEAYKDLLARRTDAVLLDGPITRYYGEIERELEAVDGSLGEVRYALAVRKTDGEVRDAIDRALDELGRDGTLRKIYEKWGLWNDATAALLGDATPGKGDVAAEAYQRWRAEVGTIPPFLERVRDRYPVTIPIFARAAALTLALSITAMALAVPLGVLLALARVFGPWPLRWLAIVYVEVLRGTPLLVQLTVIYFGLPELGLKLGPFTSGVLALGLNYAAAEAENYRAGLESIPVGQLEAAWSLGLSTPQALRFVIGPQALRMAIPPATNDFIALLKDSSLVSLVTLTELTKTYSMLASSMRDHLGLGLMVALWYLLIGLPFARLARYAEQRLGSHLKRVGQ